MREVHPNFFAVVPRILEKILERIIARGNELKGRRRQLFFWALDLAERIDPEAPGDDPRFPTACSWRWRTGSCFPSGARRSAAGWTASCAARRRSTRSWPGCSGTPGCAFTRATARRRPRRSSRRNYSRGGPPPHRHGGPRAGGRRDAARGRRRDSLSRSERHAGLLPSARPDGRGAGRRRLPAHGRRGRVRRGTGRHAFLRITDRKKEIFKTSGGKYIAPQPMENKLKESPLIAQAMVVGEYQKFPGALIVPNFGVVRDRSRSGHASTRATSRAARSGRRTGEVAARPAR